MSVRGELEQLTENYGQMKSTIAAVPGAIPYDEIRKNLGGELYSFLLKDSKIPDMVLDGAGRFIDFKKYLGIAIERGAGETGKTAEELLKKALTETDKESK